MLLMKLKKHSKLYIQNKRKLLSNIKMSPKRKNKWITNNGKSYNKIRNKSTNKRSLKKIK